MSWDVKVLLWYAILIQEPAFSSRTKHIGWRVIHPLSSTLLKMALQFKAARVFQTEASKKTKGDGPG